VIKALTGTEPVLIYGVPAYNADPRPFLLANLDLVNPVYYGPDLGLSAAQSSQIPALGAVSFDGTEDIWASPLQAGLTVVTDFIPGGTSWAPSPAQVSAQISALGLATSSNQLTGISAVGTVNDTLGTPAQDPTVQNLQAAGMPQNVPQLQSASIQKQGETAGATFLGPLGVPIKLWQAVLSHSIGALSDFAGTTVAEGSANINTVLSGVTLAVTEVAAGGPNASDSSSVSVPLNGFQLNAGDSVELNVNGGTVITNTRQRASALLLYTTVLPVVAGNQGLVGAYIKPSQYGSGTTIATAESNWAAISGEPVNVRRVYWTTGGNAMPSAITGPGTGSGNGQMADAAAGIKNYIDITPPYNPVSATYLAQIATYLSSCKANGLVADVSLWHEPYSQGLTESQFQAMFEYYGPTVREYYPVCINLESFNTQENGEGAYFPGTNNEYVDKVYVDFYASEYFDSSAIRLDAAQAIADDNGLPFGLGEFNGSTTNQTPTQLDTYFTYVQDYFQTRLSDDKVNADLLLFNDNEPTEEPYISASTDIRVPYYQAIYAALSAV
jgi:hypothetical protein